MDIIFKAKIPETFYPIYIGANDLINIPDDYSKCCVVLDKNTRQHAPRLLKDAEIIEVPCGEHAKSLYTVEAIYKRLTYIQTSRRSTLVIGIGGGAICDLTGYVAMTYMRGIRYALIPTTLVAMADAAIGAKVAVNGPNGSKNLIGGFYPPVFVQINIDTLMTLPQREYISAFGEIIKVACIADDDGSFFEFLEDNSQNLVNRSTKELLFAIQKSIVIKKKCVESDLTEMNLDRLLNLGHSIAHCIETVTGFSWLHGECVAIGIIHAAKLGLKKRLNSQAFVTRLTNLVKEFGLPVRFPDNFPISKFEKELSIIQCVRDGNMREVFPISPGKSTILHDIHLTELTEVDSLL